MAKGVIHVEPVGQRWRARHDDVLYAPHQTKAAAVSHAIDLAQRLGRLRGDASVVVQQPDGGWKTVWVYGRDCPPSKT